MTAVTPSLATLMDWLEGRLDEAAAAVVAAQVEARLDAGDERLGGDLSWLRGLREVAAQVPLHRPPALVRQSLARHFETWHQARSLTRRGPRAVPMTLLFDSRCDLPLALVRSAGSTTEVVHLGWTSEAADLVLDLTLPGAAGDRGARVAGQVLPLEPGGPTAFEVVVEGPGFRMRSVDGDEDGRFGLDDVPLTASSLTVANAELELRVAFALGHDGDA